MPYIRQEDRDLLDGALDKLLLVLTHSSSDKDLAGRLNYCFSYLAFRLFEYYEEGYTRANLINGVFVSAQQEFARRKLGPYEDQKIDENGDL